MAEQGKAVAAVIPVTDAWNAVVLEDGNVLMQHRMAFIQGTPDYVDLSDPSEHDQLVLEELQKMDSERVLVRCLYLGEDGSVSYDVHGVSPMGIPVDPFTALGSAGPSAGRYIRREQRNFETSHVMVPDST